jgi:hypothetical protein
MTSSLFPFVSLCLWVGGVVLLLGYALPLLFFPLRWAKLFQWKTEPLDPLAVYFGRCLGGVSTAIVFQCFRAAAHPERHLATLEMLIVVWVSLSCVHVWGALKREQPWPETVETVFCLLLMVLSVWLYRSVP